MIKKFKILINCTLKDVLNLPIFKQTVRNGGILSYSIVNIHKKWLRVINKRFYLYQMFIFYIKLIKALWVIYWG
jgi:hypothetical protein